MFELAIVESANDVTEVRFEIEERTKVRVLQYASTKLCTIETGERSQNCVKCDISSWDEL